MRKQTAYIKSFLSVVLMMSMLLMMTPIWGMTSHSAENSDGDAIMPLDAEQGKFGGGDGSTPETAYVISKPEHLLELADDVNNNKGYYSGVFFKLENEIDLSTVCGEGIRSWSPIGKDSDYSFNGIFDGNGEMIKGLYINATDSTCQGLFGYVKSGTVKNLTVDGSVSVGGNGNYIGGIVGRNDGGTIDNCTNKAKVTGTDATNRVGGVVGQNKNGKIINCTNDRTAEVTGNKDYTGGIVADIIDGGILQNCHNYGKVSGKTSVGGIAGGNNNGTVEGCTKEDCTEENCTKKGCINNGEVKGNNMVGGIVGKTEIGRVEGCTNKAAIQGVVIGTSAVNFVGGIVGKNGFIDERKGTSGSGTVLSCENEGQVNGGSNVGGIAGRNELGTINGCINNKDAEVYGTGGNVGGVAGSNADTIEVCKNNAKVTGTKENVGGVVGDSTGTVRICYNTGDVKGDSSDVGGVAGDNQATLQNCYNTGEVKGGSNVGGIAGNSTNAVDNCYNVGEVSGNSIFGAALGSNSGSAQNCFFFIAPGQSSKAIGDGSDIGSVIQASAKEFAEKDTFIAVEWDFISDTVWDMGTTAAPDLEPVRPILKPIPEHPLEALPTSDTSNDDKNEPGGDTPTPPTGGGTSQQPSTGGDTPSTDDTNTPSDSPSEPSTGDSEPSDSTVAGDVNVGTASGENAPEATISEETSSTLKEEVIAEHITDEEKAAIEGGDDLDIILRVEDAGDTVTDEDRKATEAAIADTGFTVGQYLDVDLIKRINGVEVGKITEINSPIRVTIEIPEELRGTNRAFAIVRLYNGSADILEDFDDDPDTITILTDRFCTYSIVYKDTKPVNPNTGITMPIAITALAYAVIVTAVSVKKRKVI